MRPLKLKEATQLRDEVRNQFIGQEIIDCEIQDVIVGPFNINLQHEFQRQYQNSELSDIEVAKIMGIDEFTLITIIFVDIADSDQFYGDFPEVCKKLDFKLNSKYL